MGKIKYYSFDIFDTCLVRTCGEPINVFRILSERLLGTDEMLQTVRNDFVYARKQGEMKAHNALRRDGAEEATLEEIYSYCDFSFATDMPKADIMAMEMEIEKQVLVPVYDMLEHINHLRGKGKQILFVIDMYLPQDFLKERLEELGFYKEGDHLFVSSESRKCKWTGHLYKYVHEQLGIKYGEWLHTCDNIYADIKSAKKLGIKTHLVEYKYSRYEKRMASFDLGNRRRDLRMMASISKSIRLEDKKEPYVAVAADFIAPNLVPYVYHILVESRQRGINKLYFMARDGWIMYHIAQSFQQLFPEIELHVLLCSRTSLYILADIQDTFERIIDWNPKLGHFLKLVKLDEFDYAPFEKVGNIREQFKALCADEQFKAFANKKQQECQSIALRYFEQEGLLQGNNALIDLDGTRSCQCALNNFIVSKGYKPLFAFYWSSSYKRICGADYSSVFFEEGGTLHVRNVEVVLFESYFCATDKLRTVGYAEQNGKMVPVYEDEPGDKIYKKKVAEINTAVCKKFAERYALMLNGADSVRMCEGAMATYSYFYAVPERWYLKVLKGLLFTDNAKSYPLLRKYDIFWLMKKRTRPYYNMNYIYNSLCPRLTIWLLEKKYALTYPDVEENRPLLFSVVHWVSRTLKRLIGKKY